MNKDIELKIIFGNPYLSISQGYFDSQYGFFRVLEIYTLFKKISQRNYYFESNSDLTRLKIFSFLKSFRRGDLFLETYVVKFKNLVIYIWGNF